MHPLREEKVTSSIMTEGQEGRNRGNNLIAALRVNQRSTHHNIIEG
jgi:hypothetical protein